MKEVLEFKYKQKSKTDLVDSVFKRKYNDCYHTSFEIDLSKNHVECGKCKAILNPMWVLNEIANKESNNRHRLIDLKKEIEETKNKMHCKCDKCGKMTRIAK